MARKRKRKGDPVHGWLILDKPVEMTSTQAVGAIKRLLNPQKAGHGGTLDPLADGILPIALGEATKTSGYAMDATKTYRFTIKWGASTSTQDREGEIVAESDVRPTKAAIEKVLPRFVGEIEQVPPKFSAIKVDGARAYDLARDGEDFELKSRTVRVDTIDIVDASWDALTLDVTCGKGFYIRALARDIATALQAEGHVTALRRLRVGDFTQANAVTLEQLEALESPEERRSLLTSVELALGHMPKAAVSVDEAAAIRQGQTIQLLPHVFDKVRTAQQSSPAPEDRQALAVLKDKAVGIGEVRAGRFKPTRVFVFD